MAKEWFILINDIAEGPFSIPELKADKRITPETLVWKDGFANWTPIAQVAELKEVFEDEEKKPDEDEIEINKVFDEQLAISLQKDPFQIFFWILIVAIVFAYLVYQLYWTP